MKVFGTGINTNPKRSGLFFRGGDVCKNLNGSNFGQPYPTKISRWYCTFPILPFLCIKLGRYGFYIGWKIFGMDHPNYLNWPGVNEGDVYPGSLALEVSARFFTDG